MKKISIEIYTRSGHMYVSDERLLSEEEYIAFRDMISDLSELKSLVAPIKNSLCYFNPRNIEAIFIRENM